MANFESTENYMKQANDLLINREFDACLKICEKGLQECTRQSQEQDNGRRKEAFCIVALQALAETNKWMETKQFLEFWYGGITRITPILAKMSMLLYIQVGDDKIADELARSWLENEENESQVIKHKVVLQTYVLRVLCANQMFDRAQNIIHSSKVLTDQEKEDLIRCIESEQSKAISENSCEDTNEKEYHSTNQRKSILQKISRYLQHLLQIRHWSQHPQFHVYLQHAIRVLVIGAFVYSLLFMNSGNVSVISPGSGMSQLWNAAVQAWKSLFFPYHLASLQ